LLVCLVPVVIRDDTAAQILAVAAIMVVSIVAQGLIRPWKNLMANILDGAMTGCILLVLVCGAVGGGYTASEATTQAISVLVVAAFLTMWMGLIGWNIYKQLNRLDTYNIFLCYDKAGGAAQARLLKFMVAEGTGQRVCLDSDGLQQFDAVLDTIKAKVQTLVVYLTRGTLTRPWCAGEIVTAFKTSKHVTVVLAPSFVAPAEEQLEAVDAYLDVSGADLLVQYGIAMADVRDRYVQIIAGKGCSHVRLDSEPTSTRHFRDLVGRLIQKPVGSAPTLGAPRPGCIILSADACDSEAVAAGGILIHLAKDFELTLKAGVCLLADHMDMGIVGHRFTIATARAVVVILSTDTLCSRHQLEIVAHAMGLSEKGQGPTTIPANLFGFSFPGSHYYGQVLPRIWPEVSEAQVRYIGAFFRSTSCPYAIHASDQVLQAQIEAIIWRFAPSRISSARDSLAASLEDARACPATPPTVLEGRPPATDDDVIVGKRIHQEWV